jgi:NDP-sugar pyrophosphorylase family protein
MVKVAGRPILEHQIQWLKKHGIFNVIFLTGYRSDVIVDHFRGGHVFGINALYSVEETPLGRGGAVKQGMDLLPEDVKDFVVMNGDNITTQDLAPMIQYHVSAKAGATLLLAPCITQYGTVRTHPIDRNIITDFKEKGEIPDIYINAGVYIFNRRIRRMLPNIGDHETTTFPHLASQHSLRAYPLRKPFKWYTMDTVADVERVSQELS